jgi:2,4-dienoyl-CoA reductase-like NADH-dependent reductase (Old Yellow Enzyme family)
MKIAGVEVISEHPGGLRTPVDQRPMLFRPITLRGVTARNRVMVAPMSQYLSIDGTVGDWQLVHLGQFAIGGAGIVCAEETAVEARGRRTHHCAGLYKNEHVRAYRRVTDFLRELGAVPAVQLGHGGRRSGVRSPWEGRRPLDERDAAEGLPPWTPVSSSAVAHGPGRMVPIALDQAGIKEVVQAYHDATRRAVDAGFDLVELHWAHGYLVNQFLSPLANQRNDAYGGDLQGRMRFALEIAEAVRAALPADKPLFVRPSVVDGKGGHWDVDDTVALVKELQARGVDGIDGSSGGLTGDSRMPAMPRHVPEYHVVYSEHIRRETGIATVAAGLITEPAQAEAVLQQGKADIIGMARELMCNPYWPVHAAKSLGLPDWLDVLPQNYAFRLYSWEKDRPAPHGGVPFEFPFRRGT